MAVQSSSLAAGIFTIPTSPTAGSSVSQSSSANTYGSYVQMTTSASSSLFITAISVNGAIGTSNPTYGSIQVGIGSSNAETTVGQIQFTATRMTTGVAGSQMGDTILVNPWIPVSSAARIAVKSASSVASSIPWNVTLQCIKQADVVTGVAETVTSASVTDKTGYSLTQTFPSNFSSLGITAGGSLSSGVIVTTNNDKTGYSLTQSFPSNFATMSITATGHVIIDSVTSVSNAVSISSGQIVTSASVTDKTGYSGVFTNTYISSVGTLVSSVTASSVTAGVTVTTNNDKTGYSLSQAFPTNFASMSITSTGYVTATNGGGGGGINPDNATIRRIYSLVRQQVK